jgi:hypothetical protein
MSLGRELMDENRTNGPLAGVSEGGNQEQRLRRRDMLLSVGALVVYALVSFGVLTTPNWPLWRQMLFSPGKAPVAGGPIDITLIHSNDTWGYVDPCG